MERTERENERVHLVMLRVSLAGWQQRDEFDCAAHECRQLEANDFSASTETHWINNNNKEGIIDVVV